MSFYHKYDFVSPEPLLSLIKEELKSYFDTGAIDDLMFPIYLSRCLERLGRGSYKIVPAVFPIKDFECRMPDDVYKIREAWACFDCTYNYQLPSSVYQQVQSCSTRLDTPDMYCNKCNECESPDIINVIYKTTDTVAFSFRKSHLLQPGNINARNHCGDYCLNLNASSPDTFDIRDNKFVVNFREGHVYVLYYSKELTESGFEMIPDNLRIQEYIEAYIKAKMFEQLSNQVTDETYNQIQQKADRYKQLADEAFQIARVETRSETAYDKHRKILRTLHRNDRYKLD